MDDVSVPLYYSVSNKLTEKEISHVQHALKFTPIVAVIVLNVHDVELARQFSDEVSIVSSSEAAHTLAKNVSHHKGSPILILEEENVGFTSHYN